MGARAEIAEGRLRSAIWESVDSADAVLDASGVRALRVLLHAGISAYWSLVKADPAQQVHAYEKTVQMLRRHWDAQSGYVCAPDPVVSARQREQKQEVAAWLETCARRSGTHWIEPAEAIAAHLISVVQGTVLRWLADCDDEAVLVAFDDLVSSLSTKAIEV